MACKHGTPCSCPEGRKSHRKPDESDQTKDKFAGTSRHRPHGETADGGKAGEFGGMGTPIPGWDPPPPSAPAKQRTRK